MKAESGLVTFSNLVFEAQPGSNSVPFLIYSTTIDTEYIESIFDPNETKNINEEYLYLNFRSCIEGEMLSDMR